MRRQADLERAWPLDLESSATYNPEALKSHVSSLGLSFPFCKMRRMQWVTTEPSFSSEVVRFWWMETWSEQPPSTGTANLLSITKLLGKTTAGKSQNHQSDPNAF